MREPLYHNPVQRGDYPDPSVIRVGEHDFWATTTSTEWAPQFPLFFSRDLVHWQRRGAVFNQRPAWSRGSFWAPELSYFKGRYYVYYVAQHESGPLTIAVATAAQPGGPYVDHGPLVGQSAGSIDPFAITGEDGHRYLLWKEDGNSVGAPTVLWVQRLRDDGLQLIGEAQMIMRNDAEWEGDVVEAACVIARGGYLYMFYSGNACCGENCKYAVGIARARSVWGPWEKYERNPILDTNQAWRCPGHGSIVEAADGRTFFLYHAYSRSEGIFVGRQLLVDEVHWEAARGGWPSINGGTGPSSSAPAPYPFERRRLPRPKNEDWQWPQAQRMELHQLPSFRHGVVLMTGNDGGAEEDLLATVLARPTRSVNYRAQVRVDRRALERHVFAGLAAYGDRRNAAGVVTGDGRVYVYRRFRGRERIIASATLPDHAHVELRMETSNGYAFAFAWSSDGKTWHDLPPMVRAAHLVPWDRGVRVALSLGGRPGALARFSSFQLLDQASTALRRRPFRFRLHSSNAGIEQ